ncbi:hypothetical protein PREVCOP_05806, partial [Segatella copri DSM 18205]
CIELLQQSFNQCFCRISQLKDEGISGAGERSSRLDFLHVPYDDDLRLTCLLGYPRTSAPEPKKAQEKQQEKRPS